MVRSARAARAAATELALALVVWLVLGVPVAAAAETTDASTTSSSTDAAATGTLRSTDESTGTSTGTTGGSDSGTSTARETTETTRASATEMTTVTSESTGTTDRPEVSTTAITEAPVTVRPSTPPAAETSTIPLASVLIAIGVLAVVALLLVTIGRRHAAATTTTAADGAQLAPPEVAAPTADRAAQVLTLMAATGEALINASYDVGEVGAALDGIARANDMPDAQVIALPTALLVSASSAGRPVTVAVTSGQRQLRLDQIEALDGLLRSVVRGLVGPGEARRQLAGIESSRPLFGPLVGLAGHMLTSLGLAVLLGAGWIDVVVATALGALVGVMLLLGRGVPVRFQVLVTVPASFGVALAVILTSGAGLDIQVLPCLIAPLVTLLPGALLTTAVIELATGQMIAGAARLAAGAMQLVLLALGIVAAATLVGVPSLDLTAEPAVLGAVGPWLAVAVFGAGIVLSQSARPTSLGWILLVLYSAYGAQVVSGVAFGAVLSALVGAVVMTPVAEFVARQRSGPPAKVSTTPAFWLLVPGALGLVGVADLLSGDAGGWDTLVTTLATMVAIAVGMLVGRALSTALFAPAIGKPGPVTSVRSPPPR